MNQLVLLLAGGLLVALGFYIGLHRSRVAQSIDDVPAPPTDSAPKESETPVELPIEPRLEPPKLLDSPTGQIVLMGGSATFSVTADGPSLSYQWFRNSVAIPGATNPTLQLEGTTEAEDDQAFEVQKKIRGCIDSLETQFRDVSEDLRGTTATLRSGLMELSGMEQRETALLLTLDVNGEVASLAQIEEQGA